MGFSPTSTRSPAIWSNFGFQESLSNLPKQIALYKDDAVTRAVETLTRKKVDHSVELEMYRAMTGAGNMSAIIQDLGYAPPKGWFDRVVQQAADIGGSVINNKPQEPSHKTSFVFTRK